VRSALERAIAESESCGPDLVLTGAHPNVVQPERIRRKALAKSGV
jgi:hypothetical protein